jgi:carboxypeptidase Q
MWAWLAIAEAKRPTAPEPAPPAEVAAQLIGAALVSSTAHDDLRVLCDDVGHRLAGSPALDRAIEWGRAAMARDGLAVHTESVTVPVWNRGEGRGAVVAPVARPLHLLALGGSPPTPPGGLTAEVLVVSSFDELAARAGEASGRVVLFDVPFTGYGETVAYRSRGPLEAAKLGAVAALVRSVSPTSLDTPHTGMTRAPEEGAATVPSAAVTLEGATQLHRLAERGAVKVHLELTPSAGPDAQSANVVGEVPGRTLPGEVVVLACHLDSWDVGQGAQDDGAGCVIAMQAAALIRDLPVPPKRTIRVVLYTNEESGLRGGKAYDEAHAAETHHAAIESDTGSGQPLGFHLTRGEDRTVEADLAALAPVSDWLAPLGAGTLDAGGAGADISPLTARGVLSMGLAQDLTDYWPIHHTEADTFDKVDPVLLARNVAAMAVMAWAVAEL